VVRLIRASLRYASKKYWVPLTKDLRLIYTAADEAAAAAALQAFEDRWGERYPAVIKLWRENRHDHLHRRSDAPGVTPEHGSDTDHPCIKR
jgi:transposase-like protein